MQVKNLMGFEIKNETRTVQSAGLILWLISFGNRIDSSCNDSFIGELLRRCL